MRVKKYNFKHIENYSMYVSFIDNFEILGKSLKPSRDKNPKKIVGITKTIEKCKVRNIIFSTHLPIPKVSQDIYETSPQDSWAEEYFNLDNKYFADEIAWLYKFKPLEYIQNLVCEVKIQVFNC